MAHLLGRAKSVRNLTAGDGNSKRGGGWAAMALDCHRGLSRPENGIGAAVQPKPEDYDYELDQALSAVVGIRALVPPDAFTAEILGTERAGHGALIRNDGIVLTIGYLITEAETVWISLSGGTHGSRPRAGLRPGDRLRPGAGAGPSRRARSAARPLQRGRGRHARRGRRRRRPQALGGGAHHRQAGVLRLLGIRAGRGDLHGARASVLGRNGADRPRRRPARHRLAANPAGDLQPADQDARSRATMPT